MTDSSAMRAFLAGRSDLDPVDRSAILAAPSEVAADRFSPTMKPYDPRDYCWSAAEVYAANPDECRKCYSARPYPDGQRHFGWALWRDCRECACDHHADEVWLA